MSRQKQTEIKLTKKQREVALLLANPESARTVTDICNQAGVSRYSFYEWIKKPEFREYVRELVDKYTDSQLGRVYRSLLKEVDKGSLQAIELFFKVKSMYVEKQVIEQKQTIQGDVTVKRPTLKELLDSDKDGGKQ